MAHRSAHLLGIVEVTKSMRGVDTTNSIQVAISCKNAVQDTVCGQYSNANGSITGYVEPINKMVELIIEPSGFKVFDMGQLVSDQAIMSISTVVAVPGSSGRLVIIGKCQKRNKRVALVFNMYTDRNANDLIDEYNQAKLSSIKLSDSSGIEEKPKPPPTHAKPIDHVLVDISTSLESKPVEIVNERRDDAEYHRVFSESSFNLTTASTEDDYDLPLTDACNFDNLNQFENDDSLSDSSAEPDYVYQETYYMSLGLSVEASERVFMKRPIRPTLRKSSTPLTEEIKTFLKEERNYIDKLDNISNAQKEVVDKLQSLLRRIPSFCQTHKELYGELSSCGNSISNIANMFLKYRDKLQPYVYYIMRAHEVNNMLSTLSDTILQKYKDIKDDIKISWRKLNFYILTLESFMKIANPSDMSVLEEALEMFRTMSKQADTEILLNGVKGSPYLLQVQGNLLLHSSFSMSGPLLRKGCNIRVFLFGKIMVITEHKNHQYDFLLDLPITQLYFVSKKPETSRSFTLLVNYGGLIGKKLYTFEAPKKEIKRAWMSMISNIHKKYAERERDLHQFRDALK